MSATTTLETKLSTAYQNLKLKCAEGFNDFDEKDVSKINKFNSVIRVATNLLVDLDDTVRRFSQLQSNLDIDIIWGTCVSQTCTDQIMEQIGGPEGNSLGSLSIVQLLDIIALVEIFRQSIEERFSFIKIIKSKKTYFDEKPEFIKNADNKPSFGIESIKEVFVWSINMLWEMHRLAQDEFLLRTRDQIDKFLTKVYLEKNESYQINNKEIVTSLCENIFSFISLHIRTICERLSNDSPTIIVTVCLILSQLRSKQARYRNSFLTSFDSCCAAANDFTRMSRQCEKIIKELNEELSDELKKETLDESSDALLSMYSSDAVFAAQKTQSYIYEPIWTNIASDYFNEKWETELTYNELSVQLVRTIDDYIIDLQTFLNEFLLQKAISALVKASTLFYLRIILRKADGSNKRTGSHFKNNTVALDRLGNDITLIREYFEEFAKEMPVLQGVIDKEFQLLVVVQEIMRIAAEISDSDPSPFILVLHKFVRDVDFTRSVVGDLWYIIQPLDEKKAWKLTKSMQDILWDICPTEDIYHSDLERLTQPELHLGYVLLEHYKESKRKRPVNPIYGEQVRCDTAALQNAQLCRKL